ncbi:hypothetical protein SEA_ROSAASANTEWAA_49 [Streptomyces phage RosaAsantewaa]|nr:hypothetical protein SEA_ROSAASANTEWAA_49 [Streptomyces phage RosaAsantewaa]
MSDAIRVSDTPIFEALKEEFAKRGIHYERLLTPRLDAVPKPRLPQQPFAKPNIEDAPTMAFERVDAEPTVKPLWVIDDEE